MAGTVGFAMVLHNHQPVGNFSEVFEEAAAKCYAPFLEVLDRETSLSCTLHYSGSLLEWLEAHRPDLLERLGGLVERGRVELLGGPFYEPILTGIPGRDAAGQIRMMRSWLEKRFSFSPRGAWLPERVWESSLASVLAGAGAEYLTLDDNHFRYSGLRPSDLTRGPYLVEDEGALIRVFPADERLRYLIPYAAPEEVVAHLSRVAESLPDGRTGLCVYADDGEKFGVWPESHTHVYAQGWLKRFFAALSQAEGQGWLRVMTLAEAYGRYEPVGRAYLPDASYREMGEWALPAREIPVYERVVAQAKDCVPDFAGLSRFIRAGQWRNFRVKYPEANRLYTKMLLVSEKVREAQESRPDDPRTAEATTSLYKGQCNCPYWHGVFGGLYLPHLRSAVYSELIRAERLTDEMRHEAAPRAARASQRSAASQSSTRGAEWVERRVADVDLDGHQEIVLANRYFSACLSVHRGGHLYELDLREKEFHVTDTLTRRYEAYHDELAGAAGAAGAESAGSDAPASIHDRIPVKEAGLASRIVYDPYFREGPLQHLLPRVRETPDPADLAAARLVGDPFWLCGEAECDLEGEEAHAGSGGEGEGNGPRILGVRFIRTGPLGEATVRLVKTVRMIAGERTLRVGYRLESVAREVEALLGVEFAFTMLAGDAPDRYYYTSEEEKAGSLSALRRWSGLRYLGMRDESQGIDLRLVPERAAGLPADSSAAARGAEAEASARADFCVYPVETVSRSEGGLERVYQGSCVVVFFPLRLPGGGHWEGGIRLEVRCG